jgi:hypothetical protein
MTTDQTIMLCSLQQLSVNVLKIIPPLSGKKSLKRFYVQSGDTLKVQDG